MLIVAGTINIDPADGDRLRIAAADMMAATHEEPGNIEYVFSVNVVDPGSIQIFEVWESGEDLEKHFTLPHMATFRETLAEITIIGTNLHRYEVASHEPM
ncbi:MAG: quinol monooxygenase YgiN [Acidimicrobiales bacterium]|jgi:quinol monooxygenase YgiN